MEGLPSLPFFPQTHLIGNVDPPPPWGQAHLNGN